MKPTRLLGIACSSGEKERDGNLLIKIKEIKNMKNGWVVFAGSTRGGLFPLKSKNFFMLRISAKNSSYALFTLSI